MKQGSLGSQAINTVAEYESFKYLIWELILVSALMAWICYARFHWNWIATGVFTFLVLVIICKIPKLALAFSILMSLSWASFAGTIAYEVTVDQKFRTNMWGHGSIWAGIAVGLVIFLISMGMHSWAIGFTRTLSNEE